MAQLHVVAMRITNSICYIVSLILFTIIYSGVLPNAFSPLSPPPEVSHYLQSLPACPFAVWILIFASCVGLICFPFTTDCFVGRFRVAGGRDNKYVTNQLSYGPALFFLSSAIALFAYHYRSLRVGLVIVMLQTIAALAMYFRLRIEYYTVFASGRWVSRNKFNEPRSTIPELLFVRLPISLITGWTLCDLFETSFSSLRVKTVWTEAGWSIVGLSVLAILLLLIVIRRHDFVIAAVGIFYASAVAAQLPSIANANGTRILCFVIIGLLSAAVVGMAAVRRLAPHLMDKLYPMDSVQYASLNQHSDDDSDDDTDDEEDIRERDQSSFDEPSSQTEAVAVAGKPANGNGAASEDSEEIQSSLLSSFVQFKPTATLADEQQSHQSLQQQTSDTEQYVERQRNQ